MSDQSTTITARRVDTDVAVIGADPSVPVLFGALKDPGASEKGRPRP
jgi:hypothetical protein